MIDKKILQKNVRYILWSWIVLGLFFPMWVEAANYEKYAAARYTVDRGERESPIVYYFTPPEHETSSYPILVLCEGSSSKGDIGSVLFIRDYFAQRIHAFPVGYLTVEKWGVDGAKVEEKDFWCHYTRSQRVEDHLTVLRHLQEDPPIGWNGQCVFVGVSEGGDIVISLSARYQDTLATINWVGAGDWNWEEELWQFFVHWKQQSLWFRIYDAMPRWLPFALDTPTTRQELSSVVEQILQNPTPQKWMGGMTYLYHADALQKPSVPYEKIQAPFLVVKGTEDSDIESCDQFVQKAREVGAPITYFRVEGMDHWLRKRPDVIEASFIWLQEQLAQGKSCIRK